MTTPINMNSTQYKATSIKQLEAMGITNNFKSHPLCFQKEVMFSIALHKGLIK